MEILSQTYTKVEKNSVRNPNASIIQFLKKLSTLHRWAQFMIKILISPSGYSQSLQLFPQVYELAHSLTQHQTLQPHGLHRPPGSSVHGIIPIRILEWVDIFSSKESSQPRNRNLVSYIAKRILYQ